MHNVRSKSDGALVYSKSFAADSVVQSLFKLMWCAQQSQRTVTGATGGETII